MAHDASDLRVRFPGRIPGVRHQQPLRSLLPFGADRAFTVALDAGPVRLPNPLLARQRRQAGAHDVGIVALHAGEVVEPRRVDAPCVLLGHLPEVIVVAVRARRRRITQPVRDLVERLGIRTRVAVGAVETRVDAGLPQVLLEDEDPLVGDGLGRLHVALDARLGPGRARCEAPGGEQHDEEHRSSGSHGGFSPSAIAVSGTFLEIATAAIPRARACHFV